MISSTRARFKTGNVVDLQLHICVARDGETLARDSFSRGGGAIIQIQISIVLSDLKCDLRFVLTAGNIAFYWLWPGPHHLKSKLKQNESQNWERGLGESRMAREAEAPTR